ncbi:MAG: chitobiase/beta-hexosaminidase C-terminal domain-containing protein [Fibrobacterota bacterium]|nr:MAG: chitobiase/beta-hexosaminidase C-terminal domain-containing protein [Fibrobacterota bacterium]
MDSLKAGAQVYLPMEMFYTTDGSDPRVSKTASSGSGLFDILDSCTFCVATRNIRGHFSAAACWRFDQGTVLPASFAPSGGTYPNAQNVTLKSSTIGAEIHYTTNGSAPTISSPTYNGPILVQSSQTIRAIATKTGWKNSAATSASYTITGSTGSVAAPAFDPAGGTFGSAQSVVLSTSTSGATIYYTVDGSAPSSSSTQYTGAIAVPASRTIRAIATKTGMVSSTISEARYTITVAPGTVATPTFSPLGRTYTTAQSVTLSCATSGASIHYTTDSSTPTESSKLYTGAIAVGTSQTIRAIATKTGMSPSAEGSATFTIAQTVAAPVFGPVEGEYPNAQDVTLSSTTAGANIYYTTDGTAPSTTSQLFSGPISVTASQTIRAIAAKPGWVTSPESKATYAIGSVEVPSFSVPAGAKDAAFSLEITSKTPGAAIHYTVDGSAPTLASPTYSGPLYLRSGLTINAIATKQGIAASGVASATYSVKDFLLSYYPESALDTATLRAKYGIFAYCNKSSKIWPDTMLIAGQDGYIFAGWSLIASDGIQGYTANVGLVHSLSRLRKKVDISKAKTLSFDYRIIRDVTDGLCVSLESGAYSAEVTNSGNVYEKCIPGKISPSATGPDWRTISWDISTFSPPTWWTPPAGFPTLEIALSQATSLRFSPRTTYLNTGTQNGVTCALCVGPTMTNQGLFLRNIKLQGAQVQGVFP